MDGNNFSTLPQDGLVALWDFSKFDEASQTLKSSNQIWTLQAHGPKISLTRGGPFGHAVALGPDQYLSIPRRELRDLSLAGTSGLSLLAWVRRDSPDYWQAIGGIWDESRSKRQFYLFLNARHRANAGQERDLVENLAHAHISLHGGPEPGEVVCRTYATSPTACLPGKWVFLASTFDSREIRVYVDGTFEAKKGSNPFPLKGNVYEGGEDGADLTIGANSVGGRMTNQFSGAMGGFAIYRRALLPDEIASSTLTASHAV
jgi:hypothetical protein